jgi:hypothetical protein
MKRVWVIAGLVVLAACSKAPAEAEAEVAANAGAQEGAEEAGQSFTPSQSATPAILTPASCTAEETPIFSCQVEGGKRLSVCGSGDGAVQYRFGDEGEAELVLDGGAWASVPYSGGGEAQIKFDNAGTHYIVFSQIIRTNFEPGEPNNPAINDGVAVFKDGAQIAKRICDDAQVKPIDYAAAEKLLPIEEELFAPVEL